MWIMNFSILSVLRNGKDRTLVTIPKVSGLISALAIAEVKRNGAGRNGISRNFLVQRSEQMDELF